MRVSPKSLACRHYSKHDRKNCHPLVTQSSKSQSVGQGRLHRVDHWLKVKNPVAPAVKREAEEDWDSKRWVSRAIRRSEPLRNDAFAADGAGVLVDDRAVAPEMMI